MLVRWVALLRRIGLVFQCLVPWHPAHSYGGATITTIHLRNFSSSQKEALHHETITLHGTWILEDSCLFVMAVVVAEEGKNTGLRNPPDLLFSYRQWQARGSVLWHLLPKRANLGRGWVWGPGGEVLIQCVLPRLWRKNPACHTGPGTSPASAPCTFTKRQPALGDHCRG